VYIKKSEKTTLLNSSLHIKFAYIWYLKTTSMLIYLETQVITVKVLFFMEILLQWLMLVKSRKFNTPTQSYYSHIANNNRIITITPGRHNTFHTQQLNGIHSSRTSGSKSKRSHLLTL